MQSRPERRPQPANTPPAKAPRKLRFDAGHARLPRPWWWLRRADDRPHN